MSFRRRVATNIADLNAFGSSSFSRHLARLHEDRIAIVNAKGFGKVHIRQGQSDILVMRQVFGSRDYEVPPKIQRRIFERQHDIIARGKTPVIVDAGANIGAASV